ncbi:hypothetical protein MMPV_007776 [Pyropia vietnamensis]
MCFLRTVDASGGFVHVTFAPLKEEARLVALSSSAPGDTAHAIVAGSVSTVAAGSSADGATSITVMADGGGIVSGSGGGIPAAEAFVVAPGPPNPSRGPMVATASPACPKADSSSTNVTVSFPRPICCTQTPIFTAKTTSSCSSAGAAGGSSAWDPLAELPHMKGDSGGVGVNGSGCGGAAMTASGAVPPPLSQGWAGAASTSHAMDVEMVSEGEDPAAAAMAVDEGHTVASQDAPERVAISSSPYAPSPCVLSRLLPMPVAANALLAPTWAAPIVHGAVPTAMAPTAVAAISNAAAAAGDYDDDDAAGYESAPDAAVDASHVSRLASVRAALVGERRAHRRGRRRVHPKAPRVVRAELAALVDASSRLGVLAGDVAARRGALVATYGRLTRRRLSMEKGRTDAGGGNAVGGGGGRGVTRGTLTPGAVGKDATVPVLPRALRSLLHGREQRGAVPAVTGPPIDIANLYPWQASSRQ